MEVVKRPFKTPLQIGRHWLNEKSFIYATIDNAPFELSVLPGLHQESLESAWKQCLLVLDKLRQRIQDESELVADKAFFGLIDEAPLCPSAMFALESWIFKRANLCVQHPWNLAVTANALLWHPSELAAKRAQGFTTFKLKIGRQESAQEINQFFSQLLPHERVRLDGNRLLDAATLHSLLRPLAPYWPQIDYIEEPFASVLEMRQWQHTVPLAWDESASLLTRDDLPQNISAIVIKPALWGFCASVNAIKDFNQRGLKVTLSSSFEDVEGLAAIYALASLQNSLQPNPAGLDTACVFK